jgi:hypothetical protein
VAAFEEQADGVGDVIDCAEVSCGCGGGEVADLLFGFAVEEHGRVDESGRDCVGGDAAWGEFFGGGVGERFDGGLGGGVEPVAR